MVIEISKDASPQEIRAAAEQVKAASRGKRSSAAFFGALKRGLDGSTYQQQQRDEWR